VELASELIKTNLRRIGHELVPKVDNSAGDIHIVQWPSMEDEAAGLTDYIHRKIKTREFDPGRTLVLCPRRQFGYMIRDALRECGHSAHSFFHEEVLDGSPKNLDESQAQQAFTLLTLLAKPDDRVALRCWLGFGSQKLRAAEYQRLREYCSNNKGSTKDVLDALANGSLTLKYTNGIKERYLQLIQRLEELQALSGQEIVDTIFPSDQEWAESIRAIIEGSAIDLTSENILETLRTNITQPELPSDVEYIRIMSLHKSKGLNADHVVVTGCIEGLIPNRPEGLSFEDERRSVEEQRRLFYVAITRPKKTLVLSSVLTLPRNLAHKMGAFVERGDQYSADTIASTFLGELGPHCPKPVRGDDWKY
jgi:superfamily I DNA/RNA helicase